MTQVYSAVNWNQQEDGFTQMFWEQNLKQMWTDTEMSPLDDIKVWRTLSEEQKDVYKKALAGLTLLDTRQSIVGIPSILQFVDGLQRKQVLSFMGMMESIHSKAYSTIFTTLLVAGGEIDELFKWVEDNKYLQYKAQAIDRYYTNISDNKSLYMAMVASVFLESFLFYSGFFYPLYLAGQAKGKMVHSGEIITLIIRDESIHGLYIGLLAQELYTSLTQEEKYQVDIEVYTLLDELMENELHYTESLYAQINLDSEVKRFLRYNANKSLMNLGRDQLFEDEEINPIVMNGIMNATPTHDFFSTKGSGYVLGVVEPILDEHFVFNTDDEFIIE